MAPPDEQGSTAVPSEYVCSAFTSGAAPQKITSNQIQQPLIDLELPLESNYTYLLEQTSSIKTTQRKHFTLVGHCEI